MWDFFKMVLAFVTGSLIVDVFGPRVLTNFLGWLIGGAWWVITTVFHFVFAVVLVLVILAALQGSRRAWGRKMDAWQWEKDHVSRVRRVGE